MMDKVGHAETVDLKSISRTLFNFILSIIVLMSLGILLTSWVLINKTFDDVYLKFLRQETTYLENGINELLKTQLSTMNDHASLPLIVNSVMHPEHDHAYLKDFMSQLRLQANDIEFTLLDINGNIIQSNALRILTDWHQKSWFSDVVDGTRDRYIEMLRENGETLVVIAVPVLYNGFPEGVLVGTFLSNLQERFSSLLEERPVFVTITSNQRPVHQFGMRLETDASQKKISLPLINGTLELEVYKSEINQLLVGLVETFLVVVVLFSAIFVIVFRQLGVKLVIEPQQLLEKSRLETEASNKKLRVANEELAQFSYRASHDLKAPLTTMKGLAQFIEADLQSGQLEEAKTNVARIARQASKLEILVIDILNLARADLAAEVREEVDIGKELENIREKFSHLLVEKDVIFSFEDHIEERVIVEKVRLVQVLENLISNGIKYSDPKKTQRNVWIESSSSLTHYRFVVRDNGIGIPEKWQDKLFDLFSRFHPQQAEGSGLGMSIAKKQLEALSGTIDLESSTSGTVCTVTIPKDMENPDETHFCPNC